MAQIAPPPQVRSDGGARDWARVARDGALAAFLFAVALLVFGGAAQRTAFWADENDYLLTARYFRHLFVERDLTNPEWGDNYWTHTQPMLARYVIGGWLWFRGHDLDEMPPRYDLTSSYEENLRKGRVPDAALIADARLPMVVFAAGSIVLLFLLGSALGGVVAGFAAAILALGSPLAQEHLVRAMPEAPLAFFILLALWLAVAGIRRGEGGGLPARWAVALGIALGLGLGTKLTAVLSLVAVLVWGALVAILATVTSRESKVQGSDFRPSTLDFRLAVRVGRGWALALLVALGVFVLSDPHLYPDPVSHTGHLFQQRLREERGRQREVPRLAVRDPLERPSHVLGGSLVDGGPIGSRGLPVEAVLAVVGLAALLAESWRDWRRNGQVSASGLALLTALVYFVGVSAGLYLLYARYLVPTFLLGALLSGVGARVLILAGPVPANRSRKRLASSCTSPG